MKRTARSLLLLAFTGLLGCSNPVIDPDPLALNALRVDTTPDTVSILDDARSHYQKIFPEVTIESQQTGHTQLTASLKSDSSIFFLSYQPVTGDTMQAIPILRDGLALITHLDNPIDALTIDDIRRIYQGFMTDWTDAGNQSTSQIIQPLSPASGSDTRAVFEQLVMGRRMLSSSIQFVPDSDTALNIVAETPGTLAYIPVSLVDDRVKILAIDGILPNTAQISANQYPLRMTVYINGNRSPDDTMMAFIRLLQQPGQYMSDEQRYVPLIE